MKLILPILIFAFHSFAQTDTLLLEKHLRTITKTNGFRTYKNTLLLNQTAHYIHDQCQPYADTVFYQEYSFGDQVYKNVIASFGPRDAERIIIGAHYDVCQNQEGADDNASGVAGMLELARQLKGEDLTKRIDLVAYTLEEPPFFRTEKMGSFIHAQSLKEENAQVVGMISLEMIGYFKDERKTQDYPLGILSLFYGSRGNYITLVKKFGSGKFVHRFCKQFKKSKVIRTKKFTGPKKLAGIDFSDHLNYWKFGYSAMMITDTSFYRNKNYHQKTDTMETLDLVRMAKVVDGVLLALMNL